MMEVKNRSTCDNNCSHGCSTHKQYARVVLNSQPVVKVLCAKAMIELNAKVLHSIDKKAA